MIAVDPVQVFVEPDTVGPWLGLVGVAVGAVVGWLTSWTATSNADRKAHKAAADAATSELVIAANQLTTVVGAFITADPSPAQLIDWHRDMRRELERIQSAYVEIVRNAPHLIDTAGDVQLKAIYVARKAGQNGTFADLAQAIQRYNKAAFFTRRPRRRWQLRAPITPSVPQPLPEDLAEPPASHGQAGHAPGTDPQ
jgi:hypothetical protein